MYVVVVSFIGGRNRRNPLTCLIIDKLYNTMLYRVHLYIKPPMTVEMLTKSINRYGTDSANLSELRFDLMIYSA